MKNVRSLIKLGSAGVALLLLAGPASGNASVLVKVSLFPVGSFEINSAAVEGKGEKKGDAYAATALKVPVSSLKTGIELRDEHMQKRLNPENKHPHVIVEDIKATGGEGSANITVAGVKKEVKFKYKDLGNGKAEATFPLKLADFKIEDVSYKGVGVEDEVEVVATIPYDGK